MADLVLSHRYFRAVCISQDMPYIRLPKDIFISFWISTLHHYCLH